MRDIRSRGMSMEENGFVGGKTIVVCFRGL